MISLPQMGYSGLPNHPLWRLVFLPMLRNRGSQVAVDRLRVCTDHALVAQLDRAMAFEAIGRGFESLRARQFRTCL